PPNSQHRRSGFVTASNAPTRPTTLFFSLGSQARRLLPVLRRHRLDRVAVQIVTHRSLGSAGGEIGPRACEDLDLDLERSVHRRVSTVRDIGPDADLHRQAAAFSAHPLE